MQDLYHINIFQNLSIFNSNIRVQANRITLIYKTSYTKIGETVPNIKSILC